MNFSTGGWLIGGRPNVLLIRGDHLFLNYLFFLGSGGWLIGGIINPHLTLAWKNKPTNPGGSDTDWWWLEHEWIMTFHSVGIKYILTNY